MCVHAGVGTVVFDFKCIIRKPHRGRRDMVILVVVDRVKGGKREVKKKKKTT